LKKCKYLFECVSEDWNIKKELYETINKFSNPNSIISSVTSCISITKIASKFQFPTNVIGVHFMNPVPLKNLVEVVKGYHTSETTIVEIKTILKSIGKNCIVVNDSPGFVANRLSHLFMNEAAFLLQENIASAKDIDMIFKHGYGHAMGPLETADMIGLDTVANSLDILYQSFQDSKFKCCFLLRKMVDAGKCGIKTGEGFYKYK
jgi:3-hydroxybutyryl-CoA dehydrogenase